MGTWWLDVGTAGLVRGGWMWAGAAGSVEVPRCGHRFLDVGTSGFEVPRCGHRFLDVGTSGGGWYEVPKCRYQVPRCRHGCLDVGTA